jgi:phosphatidylglycerol---prolipoprotein diacylglyceryl transferase
VYPILFEVGSFPIHTYGVMGALGFLAGCGVVLWRCHRLGIDLSRVSDVVFWGTIASLLGSRLVFVLQNPGSVHSLWEFFDLRSGGLVLYGAFFTGLPVGFGLIWRFGLPMFRLWDVFGTGLPLAHAFSRVGCFAAGCCYGSPWSGAFGVTYPADNPLTPHDGPVHAVQLYEAVSLALIAVVTNVFFAHRKWDGQVFLLYALLYAGARAVIELFRGDAARGWFLPQVFGHLLTFSQGISIVFALGALALFLGVARRPMVRSGA